MAVNLAAIPKDLVESALFGHEKGAFTGAIRQQLGKFELAAGGTLFLDEIGDLKYELQAKLLRAIQEEEIERVGGTHPIKTDLRLIAATNVDLEKAVKDGRFREDLYYRLNVIPIRMPALRDRLEDLPELARFFLRRYNVKFRKNVQGIAESTLDILSSYWWPGNIRELENLIERLVAVSDKDWITDEDLPVRASRREARYAGSGSDGKSPGACALDIRAQLHRAGAREVLLERDGHLTSARHPVEHAQIQDGQAGDPPAGTPDQRQLGEKPGAFERRRDQGESTAVLRWDRAYFLGRTASLSCFAIRALTTVLAGILIASPVAGLRPMRAFRFWTTSFTIPGSTNSPDRLSSFSERVVNSSKNSLA